MKHEDVIEAVLAVYKTGFSMSQDDVAKAVANILCGPEPKKRWYWNGAWLLEEKLSEIAAEIPPSEWDKLPKDLSENLDHYLYGTPKREIAMTDKPLDIELCPDCEDKLSRSRKCIPMKWCRSCSDYVQVKGYSVVPADLPARFLSWASDRPFLRRLVQYKNLQEIADWLERQMK